MPACHDVVTALAANESGNASATSLPSMAVTGEDEEWILVGNAMVAADGYLAAVDEDSDEESVISSGSEHSSDEDAVPRRRRWARYRSQQIPSGPPYVCHWCGRPDPNETWSTRDCPSMDLGLIAERVCCSRRHFRVYLKSKACIETDEFRRLFPSKVLSPAITVGTSRRTAEAFRRPPARMV